MHLQYPNQPRFFAADFLFLCFSAICRIIM
nr:MAG TPA: hypothetical protein [Bacteriophage sp.]